MNLWKTRNLLIVASAAVAACLLLLTEKTGWNVSFRRNGLRDDVKSSVQGTKPSFGDAMNHRWLQGVPTVSPTRGSVAILPVAVVTTLAPTRVPTIAPTRVPTIAPTRVPTVAPTRVPTVAPLPVPSPTAIPQSVLLPTSMPTVFPTYATYKPTVTGQPYPVPRYYTPTYYYNPSYYTQQPYYSYPTRPYYTPNDEPSEEEKAEQAQKRKAALITVAVMFGVTIIVLICGRNTGEEVIENFDSPEAAVEQFYEEIFSNKYLTFTIPKFKIPCPCSKKLLYDKPVATRHALFFTTRIKCKWRPLSAYTQFVVGWVSLFTTIIGLIAPSNTINSVIGCGAMFIGELIVHVWYGYFRYPNLASCCNLQNVDDDFFDLVKEYSTILFHGDGKHHYDKRIEYVGFIPTLIYHVASGFFMVLIGGAITVLSIIGCCVDDDRGRRRRRDDDSDVAKGWFAISVWIGSLLGSVIYPLLFLLATNPALKVIAPILHHVAQEYYEAKLFEKDLNHLWKSIAFKFFAEMFFPIGDDSSEMIADLEDELKNVVEDLDPKQEESNGTARNDTESNDEGDFSGSTRSDESEVPTGNQSDAEFEVGSWADDGRSEEPPEYSDQDGEDLEPPEDIDPDGEDLEPPDDIDPDGEDVPEDERDRSIEEIEVEYSNSKDIDIELGVEGDDSKGK